MSFSSNPLPQSFDFIKLNLGTKDFLLIDHLSLEEPLQEEVYRRLCTRLLPRSRGVGASVLLVLLKGRGIAPLLKEFLPGRESTAPGYDSMTAAARYLFDTARYGTSLIPLETTGGSRTLEPLDSHTFRINLGIPVQDPSEEPSFTLTTRIRVYFAAGLKGSLPPAWKDQKKKAPPSSVPLSIRVHLISQEELKVDFPKNCKERDMLEAMAVAAFAALREGFCSHQVLVRGRKTQCFTEINPQTGELKVTSSAAYVFSGTYSWS